MKKVWLIAGALVGCSMGASLGACSSTNSTGGTATGTTTHTTTTGMTTSGSTTTTATGTAGNTTTTTSGTGGTTTTTSGTGNCSTVGTLHPPKAGDPKSLYCPFSGDGGTGSTQYCDPTSQHCCETTADAGAPSTCDPAAMACPSAGLAVDWTCEDPVADCKNAATPVCCAPGASIGLGNPGCGNFAHTMKNTVCVATGACTGIILCTNNAECPTATPTCTPFSKAGNQVGGCM